MDDGFNLLDDSVQNIANSVSVVGGKSLYSGGRNNREFAEGKGLTSKSI